ncbi:hypothetical protein Tco_0221348 [Tanacetum coccineum]
MVEETPPTIPLSTPEEGPNGSNPKEPPVGDQSANKPKDSRRYVRPGRSPYSIHGNYGRSQATGTGLVSLLSLNPEWSCPILVRQLATEKYKRLSQAKRQVTSKLLTTKEIPKDTSRNP